MTKSTITRDELNEVIATYGKHHIAHRMANVLLAAMDSEPDCKERKLFCSTDTTRMRKTISVSAGTEDAPLYRHAQQPIVSADLLHTAASAIEDLLTTKDRTGAGVWFDLPFRLRSAANAQPAPVAPVCTCPSGDGSLRWPCPLHPGNSPVVPDGIERVASMAEYLGNFAAAAIIRQLAVNQPQNAPQNIPEIIPDSCTWTFSNYDEHWTGTCGVEWIFPDGGPKENGVKFCPKCGKSVAVSATEGTEE